MTRGHKTSELKVCLLAFVGGFVLALYGIHKGVDLTALGILVGSVVLPLLGFGVLWTTLIVNQGENCFCFFCITWLLSLSIRKYL